MSLPRKESRTPAASHLPLNKGLNEPGAKVNGDKIQIPGAGRSRARIMTIVLAMGQRKEGRDFGQSVGAISKIPSSRTTPFEDPSTLC